MTAAATKTQTRNRAHMTKFADHEVPGKRRGGIARVKSRHQQADGPIGKFFQTGPHADKIGLQTMGRLHKGDRHDDGPNGKNGYAQWDCLADVARSPCRCKAKEERSRHGLSGGAKPYEFPRFGATGERDDRMSSMPGESREGVGPVSPIPLGKNPEEEVGRHIDAIKSS